MRRLLLAFGASIFCLLVALTTTAEVMVPGRTVIPAIQVKEAYRPETMTAAEFERHLSQALLPPSRGVALWEWPALEKDRRKQEILLAAAEREF